MYEDLINRLRNTYTIPPSTVAVMNEAADAIEELSRAQEQWIEPERKILLKSVPKWISVAERLPEEWGVCLCWYEYYHVSRDAIFPEYGLGVWNNDDKCWCGEVANGRSAKVLAWMPLPEPYEPPKEET